VRFNVSGTPRKSSSGTPVPRRLRGKVGIEISLTPAHARALRAAAAEKRATLSEIVSEWVECFLVPKERT